MNSAKSQPRQWTLGPRKRLNFWPRQSFKTKTEAWSRKNLIIYLLQN